MEVRVSVYLIIIIIIIRLYIAINELQRDVKLKPIKTIILVLTNNNKSIMHTYIFVQKQIVHIAFRMI